MSVAFLAVALSSFAQSTPTAAPAQQSSARAHALFVATSAQLLKDMDREKARLGYRQVVKIDERYGPAWFNLGVLAEAANDWTEAKSDFEKYLSVAPQGAYAKRAQRELGRIAVRMAHPVLTKDQKYDASIQRARALLAARFYKESIEEAASAQAIDGSRWEAYAVVSLCMAEQKRRAEALKFASLAAEHAPTVKREQVRATLMSEVNRDVQPEAAR